MQCLSMQCLSMHSLAMCMNWLQLTCLTPGSHPAAAEIRTWEQTKCHNWSAIGYCRTRRTTDNVMHINRRHRSDIQATTVLHTLVRQCQSINESYLLLHALGQLACFWVSDSLASTEIHIKQSKNRNVGQQIQYISNASIEARHKQPLCCIHL